MNKFLIFPAVIFVSIAVNASTFCQFWVAACPEGTTAGSVCYKKMCNGVLANELTIVSKEEAQQFSAMWLKGPVKGSIFDTCKRLTGVDILERKGDEQRQELERQKFESCMQRYGPTGFIK